MTAPPVKIAVVGMATLALIAVLLGIAHVARHQQVIQLGYQLARATQELADNQEENRRLRLEKSILTNPARIRRLAESLGMAQPGPEQIRVIRVPSSTVAQQAPAAPQQLSRRSEMSQSPPEVSQRPQTSGSSRTSVQ